MENQSNTKAQLQQAYQYIKAGQRATALKILAPICKNEPNNAAAWWLAANAFDDVEHIRYALQQVLKIDPQFPRAAEKLAQLEFPQSIRTERPTSLLQRTEKVSIPQKKRSSSWGWGWVLGFAVILIAVAIGAAIISVTQHNGTQESTPTQALAEVQNIEQSPTAPADTLTPIPTTAIPLPPTLPPQDTPTLIPPSRTPLGPRPTRTPRPSSTPITPLAPPATIDTGLFGDTYWEGDGEGANMDSFASSRGRYLRFYQFPVLVYVIDGDTQVRRNVVNGALKEINQVVSIRITDELLEADIILEFEEFEVIQERCEADEYLVLGCGSIDYFGGGFYEPIIKGNAIVSIDDNLNLQGTVLHELLHAMGIFAHSPNPNDVMYYEEAGVSRMSARDINTLRRLYEGSPSYSTLE